MFNLLYLSISYVLSFSVVDDDKDTAIRTYYFTSYYVIALCNMCVLWILKYNR